MRKSPAEQPAGNKSPMKKRQNAELRKPDILKNYYQVILKEGVEGASIAKVAKRMKINPSLIIHYFATKDTMTEELIHYISKMYDSLFMRLRVETDDPAKRLDRLVDMFFSEEWYNNTDISGDFSVISVSFRNKKVFARIQKMYEEFIKLIVRDLESISASGIISIENPRRTAELLVSVVEGHRHFKHFYVNKDEAEEYKQEMIDAIKTILKSGK